MHRRLFSFAALPAFALAVAFAANAAPALAQSMTDAPTSRAYLHGYNVPASGVAIDGYCPVAYIEANKAIKGKAEFPSTYNGVTYHFVSAGAKKLFDANPEKYLPAYGGWCATGIVHGKNFPVDPTNFKVVNGRTLLFLRNASIDAKAIWGQGDEASQLAKADANWAKH